MNTKVVAGDPMPSRIRFLAAVLAAAFALAPAFANNGNGNGNGKAKGKDKHEQKHAQKEGKHGGSREVRQGAYFNDHDRDSVRHYYASSQGKKCPPGLAKKNNGCMPPGQAKKWHVGQPLPRDVVVYSVPQPILVTLPPPPAQHKYVRVAGDILLIAVGTQMVVDGINGLLN
jgi:Ni/Co efflux regulator RcnB